MKKTISIFRSSLVQMAIFQLCLGAAIEVGAQTYNTNFNDIAWNHTDVVKPLNFLGQPTHIIDIRGFMPIAAQSKTAWNHANNPIRWFTDTYFYYYTFPNPYGFSWIIYGNWDINDLTKVTQAEIIREDKAEGEDLKWVKLSYYLTKESGQDLFQALGGDSGYKSSEPLAVISFEQSIVVLLNFKYSTFATADRCGQVIGALEFSKTMKEFKTFYNVFSTFHLAPDTKLMFDKATPFVKTGAAIYFGVSN